MEKPHWISVCRESNPGPQHSQAATTTARGGSVVKWVEEKFDAGFRTLNLRNCLLQKTYFEFFRRDETQKNWTLQHLDSTAERKKLTEKVKKLKKILILMKEILLITRVKSLRKKNSAAQTSQSSNSLSPARVKIYSSGASGFLRAQHSKEESFVFLKVPTRARIWVLGHLKLYNLLSVRIGNFITSFFLESKLWRQEISIVETEIRRKFLEWGTKFSFFSCLVSVSANIFSQKSSQHILLRTLKNDLLINLERVSR